MIRKILSCIMAVILCMGVAVAEAEDNCLRVENPTPMRGRFCTLMWGGTTSDLDVQHLIHGYSLAKYDIGETRYRFDRSVVQNALKWQDENGDYVYQIAIYDDLLYSDGTPITVRDYIFSILFGTSSAILETGGKPLNFSWIRGMDEYMDGRATVLSGVRILNDLMFRVTVKKEAMPYFYELSRFEIYPYPIAVIAPETKVLDDGMGAYLSEPLTAELLQRTVLDPDTGYLTHPSVVSGPYLLTKYGDNVVKFSRNDLFKGNETGYVPRIDTIEYGEADHTDMVGEFDHDQVDLINKVTEQSLIGAGLEKELPHEAYERTGLTMVWFKEESPKVQELAVRKAIAYCFDRRGFTNAYTDGYGTKVDGFYGIGQWMYLLGKRRIDAPITTETIQASNETAISVPDLSNMTVYGKDLKEASKILDEAGWKMNADGIRYKNTANGQLKLELTLGLLESEQAAEYLDLYLGQNLRSIGIALTFMPLNMERIEQEYSGETCETDLLYLGEDFNAWLNIDVLKPKINVGNMNETLSLSVTKQRVYDLATKMVAKDPADLIGFYLAWVDWQETISETLPLLAVYSNQYYDFYNDRLKNYHIRDFITWSEAIVEAYLIN